MLATSRRGSVDGDGFRSAQPILLACYEIDSILVVVAA
jgi:hypothetical protein